MHRLTYVFDSYCGWCYGFGPAIRGLAADADIADTVRHGALFGGGRAAPVGTFGHIPQANARISALTGVQFGAGSEQMLARGTAVMNSDDAARGLVALRTVAGTDQGLAAAGAMQDVFFQHGKSLSDVDTYRWIAAQLGADTKQVSAAFVDPAVAAEARAEQEWVAAARVDHYPTLLAETARGLVEVGHPTASAQELRAAIEQVA